MFKEGRRLKALLRLGCHGLKSVSGEVGEGGRPQIYCPACPHRVETDKHVICECPAYEVIRRECFGKVARKVRDFTTKSSAEKVATILDQDKRFTNL